MGLRKKISEVVKSLQASLRGIETDEYKQTVGKLTSYLDSLGVHVGEIDPVAITHRWKGDGGMITVFLKNSNIDGLFYWTRYWGPSDVSGNAGSQQGPHFTYALKFETGNKRKELRINTKKIKNGIFGRPVDFKWVGGQIIADILNQDTELKEPLYDELNITHPKEFDESSWTGRYCNIRRKGDIEISSSKDVVLIETPETESCEDLLFVDLKSTFPPPHVFKAYDKIAKHIREYVQG